MADQYLIDIVIRAQDQISAQMGKIQGSLEQVTRSTKSVDASGILRVATEARNATPHVTAFGNAAQTAGSLLGGMAKTVLAAAAGFAAGLGLTAGLSRLKSELTSVGQGAVDFGGQVLKLSQQTGLAAEQSSGLLAVFNRYGLELPQATVSLGFFSKAILGIEDASEKAFTQGKTFAGQMTELGVQTRDASGQIRPLNAILLEVADRFKAMPDGVDKTAASMILFGRSGKDLLPILNLGAQGIRDLEAQAARFGLTITAQNLPAIRGYITAHRDLNEAWNGLKLTLGVGLMPLMTGWTEQLTALTAQLSGWVTSHQADITAFVARLLADIQHGFSWLQEHRDDLAAFFRGAVSLAGTLASDAERLFGWLAKINDVTGGNLARMVVGGAILNTATGGASGDLIGSAASNAAGNIASDVIKKVGLSAAGAAAGTAGAGAVGGIGAGAMSVLAPVAGIVLVAAAGGYATYVAAQHVEDKGFSQTVSDIWSEIKQGGNWAATTTTNLARPAPLAQPPSAMAPAGTANPAWVAPAAAAAKDWANAVRLGASVGLTASQVADHLAEAYRNDEIRARAMDEAHKQLVTDTLTLVAAFSNAADAAKLHQDALNGAAAAQGLLDAAQKQSADNVDTWTGMQKDAQSALDMLVEKRKAGIALSPAERESYDTLTWAVARYTGGVTDQQQAYVDAQVAEANYVKTMDSLNAALANHTITQQQYDQAVADVTAKLPLQELAQLDLAKSMDRVKDAIYGMTASLELYLLSVGAIPVEKVTQVKLVIEEAGNKQLNRIQDMMNAGFVVDVQLGKVNLQPQNVWGQGGAGGVGTDRGMYAAGGVIPGPTLAMLGEHGYREYVIPTEPAYRGRGLGLWMQAGRHLGVPGFAEGGAAGGGGGGGIVGAEALRAAITGAIGTVEIPVSITAAGAELGPVLAPFADLRTQIAATLAATESDIATRLGAWPESMVGWLAGVPPAMSGAFSAARDLTLPVVADTGSQVQADVAGWPGMLDAALASLPEVMLGKGIQATSQFRAPFLSLPGEISGDLDRVVAVVNAFISRVNAALDTLHAPSIPMISGGGGGTGGGGSAYDLLARGAGSIVADAAQGLDAGGAGIAGALGPAVLDQLKRASTEALTAALSQPGPTGSANWPAGNAVLDMARQTAGEYGWCEKFVGDVMARLGLRYSRAPTAEQHAHMQPLSPGFGPAGAIVYFPWDGAGHVAFSLGDGSHYFGTVAGGTGVSSGMTPYGWTVNPMARGGLVTRPTLALLGEAGPEAVIPLGRGATPPKTDAPKTYQDYYDSAAASQTAKSIQEAAAAAAKLDAIVKITGADVVKLQDTIRLTSDNGASLVDEIVSAMVAGRVPLEAAIAVLTSDMVDPLTKLRTDLQGQLAVAILSDGDVQGIEQRIGYVNMLITALPATVSTIGQRLLDQVPTLIAIAGGMSQEAVNAGVEALAAGRISLNQALGLFGASAVPYLLKIRQQLAGQIRDGILSGADVTALQARLALVGQMLAVLPADMTQALADWRARIDDIPKLIDGSLIPSLQAAVAQSQRAYQGAVALGAPREIIDEYLTAAREAMTRLGQAQADQAALIQAGIITATRALTEAEIAQVENAIQASGRAASQLAPTILAAVEQGRLSIAAAVAMLGPEAVDSLSESYRDLQGKLAEAILSDGDVEGIRAQIATLTALLTGLGVRAEDIGRKVESVLGLGMGTYLPGGGFHQLGTPAGSYIAGSLPGEVSPLAYTNPAWSGPRPEGAAPPDVASYDPRFGRTGDVRVLGNVYVTQEKGTTLDELLREAAR